MKNNMCRKGLVCGILFVLVGINIMPMANSLSIEKHVLADSNTSRMLASNDGNTLYVGGSGPGNYTRIQDAIDNASDGDTVFVYDDSSPYYENVVVDKSINLTGENRDNTVIDGTGIKYVIAIVTHSVTIERFTIQNGINGIYIQEYSGNYDNNIIIDNNILSNKYGGIDFYRCVGHIISNNTISNNKYGIRGIASADNIISYNIISNNEEGIMVDVNRDDNISHNTISNNGKGLVLEDSHDNIIYKNNIEFNVKGICLTRSINNKIFSNNFINNTRNVRCEGESYNKWDKNYWDGPRLFPKLILEWKKFWIARRPIEIYFLYPWPAFDRNPAQEPYDIPGGDPPLIKREKQTNGQHNSQSTLQSSPSSQQSLTSSSSQTVQLLQQMVKTANR